MIRRFASERFNEWILAELPRARDRVRELRERYPSAPPRELAQRLMDEKKKWATTGGAISGLFGLATLPADLAFVAYLQVSLIVDLAVLNGRNLKSARAREEVLDIFGGANDAANFASRASPKAVARIAERLLSAKGLRLLGRVIPVVAAPVTAALNNRDLQKAGEEAMRYYAVIPQALSARRVAN
jgi:uncharacterized protein (DUF697 family)